MSHEITITLSPKVAAVCDQLSGNLGVPIEHLLVYSFLMGAYSSASIHHLEVEMARCLEAITEWEDTVGPLPGKFVGVGAVVQPEEVDIQARLAALIRGREEHRRVQEEGGDR
jgi:hypothetical protein